MLKNNKNVFLKRRLLSF